MQFKQFYLGCLSHASYYVGSEKEAVVIDPQRDVEQYIEYAAANGQQIKYIIETHSHADFVSGHVELAEKTGAEIIYGSKANTEFATYRVKDGDQLTVGKQDLTFLETPGHTPEGITVLAKDTTNPAAPVKMFTGDALFIGDVGRPDLIGSKGHTAEEMGGMLYESLHNKILPLSDDTEVYPAHGAGSLCGKSLSKETWSTLGEQRKSNYALQPMSKEEFIKIVSADQLEVPAYFAERCDRYQARSRIWERTHSQFDQHRAGRSVRTVGRHIDRDRNTRSDRCRYHGKGRRSLRSTCTCRHRNSSGIYPFQRLSR
jgi:hydroxyacylglutathione hydrolase